ncbi:MAG: DNA polymerase IV [Candidatus Bathyarchaeota archaeon]|jgi:DNA polymerase IV (DinB-like DNA polymerase)|nr:DNA polymerase IV [Candidatus Bathyarchaeota archaeon A05DMB-5]MDH7607658.1 DNA polymerase IV [Candidatus Bathyarchaeota archaeon]
MAEKKRVIFHVDMDQFFAAVEERTHPEYKGKPVIVGADPKEGRGRGVVSTCNYEARKFGVRSGMPISKAWKLCPNAVYLPVNYELYMKVSEDIMNILRKYADKFECWGIDEAFLDVTAKVKDYAEAEALARQIKNEIYGKEQLTCSIGVGPNKLVAKIASDFQKPDGLTVVKEEDAEKFLAPLPVRKLLWVGRKTEQKLKAMGIKTIGDLARFDPTVLTEKFGVVGTQMYLMARGIDRSEVEERGEVKSISRETTFEEDTSDFGLILDTADRLSEEVLKDVLRQNLYFKTVTVKVRYENFETHTHSKTLPFFTNRLQDLSHIARELLEAYFRPNRKIRLIGVRVSSFVSGEKQKTLA